MGRRGPKPKTRAELAAAGSSLAKSRGDAPPFAPGSPTCPSWLSAEAKAEWRRVAKLLAAAGLLSKAHRAALTAYAIAWARLVEAEAHVAREGAVLIAKTGVGYQNPWLAIANKARNDVVKLAQQFGMTPASSSAVKAAALEDDDDPLAPYRSPPTSPTPTPTTPSNFKPIPFEKRA